MSVDSKRAGDACTTSVCEFIAFVMVIGLQSFGIVSGLLTSGWRRFGPGARHSMSLSNNINYSIGKQRGFIASSFNYFSKTNGQIDRRTMRFVAE